AGLLAPSSARGAPPAGPATPAVRNSLRSFMEACPFHWQSDHDPTSLRSTVLGLGPPACSPSSDSLSALDDGRFTPSRLLARASTRRIARCFLSLPICPSIVDRVANSEATSSAARPLLVIRPE